jgi:hypothetical protein
MSINASNDADAGAVLAASTRDYDPEALKREAIRILIKNHICNCKTCKCERHRGR